MGLDPMDKDFIGLHSVCISSSFKLKSVLSMYMTGRKAECGIVFFSLVPYTGQLPKRKLLFDTENIALTVYHACCVVQSS